MAGGLLLASLIVAVALLSMMSDGVVVRVEADENLRHAAFQTLAAIVENSKRHEGREAADLARLVMMRVQL